MVTSSVYFSSSTYCYIWAWVATNEIFIVLRFRLFGPFQDVFRSWQLALNYNADIFYIFQSNRHGVEHRIWYSHNSFTFWNVISFIYCHGEVFWFKNWALRWSSWDKAPNYLMSIIDYPIWASKAITKKEQTIFSANFIRL